MAQKEKTGCAGAEPDAGTWRLPEYHPPDFEVEPLASAPCARTAPAPADGVAPDNFHATSNYPEYVRLGDGDWGLVAESRMDCVLTVLNRTVEAVEFRRLQRGASVVLGRSEDGSEGIYVHTEGFTGSSGASTDKFAFRTRGTRETPFSRSYEDLYDLLRYERAHGGYVCWVLGPAVAFDKDSRLAMQKLIENGYCQALLAGNALATHDLEAACFQTGLGQDIYTQALKPKGHYHHLMVLNNARRAGSMRQLIDDLGIRDGIMHACEKHDIPTVLAGSIRDDGPLPEVIPDVYAAQDAMRVHARKATTVIALATQLHAIAFGNMTPGYRVVPDGAVRPVYFYIVDMSEFGADKLANRGSSQVCAILTNVQDFMINLGRNLE